MEQLSEKKNFAEPDGMLNADDVDTALGLNEWVNMENCRVGSTDKGYTAILESIGGTLLKSAVQPSVTFICIGTAEDEQNNRLIYFLYNKFTPDHKILCYSKDDDTVYTVLLSTQVTGGLSFNKNYLIHSARVIDGLLYWTDDLNEYRRINIDSGIKLNHPSFNTDATAYTDPLAQSVIKLIRRPPGTAPTAVKGTDGGVTTNLFGGFAGEFSVRYYYRDGEYSVFSPSSNYINYNKSSDTYNKVDVSFSAGNGFTRETIEQDVLSVELAVRYNNENSYFVVKTWSKDVPAEATEISNYNSGSALTYSFFNDLLGVPVSEAGSLKLFDSIPLNGKCLEAAGDRLYLGNYVKGYGTPLITSLDGSAAITAASPTTQPIFRPFSSYQIAIRFRDYEKRQCAVVTNDTLIVTIPVRSYDFTTITTGILWSLDNAAALTEIPDWAYYYDVLITKNLQTRFFVESKSPLTKYAVRNSDGTFTYQNNYTPSIYALALDASLLFGANMGYSFQDGDIANVIIDSNNYYLNVIGQDGNYILVKPEDLGTLPNALIAFDVYSPHKTGANEFFYSIGEDYNVLDPYTTSRRYSTLTGTISGDCYLFRRLYTGSTYYYSAAMSPNDTYWKDWFQIYGEINVQSPLGQVNKTNFVQWSDTKIEGTKINGLSSFDSLSEKSLPVEMGGLNKLQLTSKVQNELGVIMLGIGRIQTASIYLGETQQYGSAQQTTLTLSTDVIGTVNVLKGNFGTSNPESVVEFRGNVFWVDVNSGRVIQYSTNGLYPISSVKINRFWKLFSDQYNSMTAEEIEALGGRPFIFSTVDPYHNEVLFSIPKLLSTPPKGYLPDYPSTIFPFDIWDGTGKTIVYKLDDGKYNPRWLGSYSFNPEYFITLGSELYALKNGQLYLHNQTANYNEFYGTQYKTRIMPIWNIEPNVPKVYNAAKIEANMTPTLVYFYTESPYQQASDLVDFDFTNYEGMYYATLYRNRLVPTASGYDTNGLLTAEKMRSYAMRVLIEFTVSTIPAQLRFATLEFILSRGHNK